MKYIRTKDGITTLIRRTKMTKELTPLEAFYDLLSPIGLKEAGLKRYNLIETALNKLIELEDTLIDVKNGSLVIVDVEKIKALEIIKEKRIDVATLLDCRNVEEYNRWVDNRSHYSYQPLELTQEEYDLLKEVML